MSQAAPDVVIRVERLSKQYRLGVVGTGTLVHDMNRWWHRVRGRPDPYVRVTERNQRERAGESPFVWALHNLNFDVRRGEVLGIIGRNGAGKSTLLKILSRVTAPTAGEVRIRGRIASLLEVGTGFHPELTGIENVFLNGAILGMTRAEIRRKLDEIVEFSGCKRYVDTPVKRYSSGMMVRLGFAVAAHLEPEILVVDEVLAVGDAQFQQKCIGKMSEVSRGGRTVLFVSHNMSAISNLCTRAIVLEDGQLECDGGVAEGVQHYSRLALDQVGRSDLAERTDRRGSGEIRLQSVSIENADGTRVNHVAAGDHVRIVCRTNAREVGFERSIYGSIVVRDLRGLRVWTVSAEMKDARADMRGRSFIVFDIPRMPLSENEYVCDIRIAEGNDTFIQDWVTAAFSLKVVGNDYFHSGQPQCRGLDVFFADFDFYSR